MNMNVSFPKTRVTHKKGSHRISVVYAVGPDQLKSIAFVDAICIWAAVAHYLQNACE